MAELLDDESYLYSPDSARPIEILPEMLDYAFVDTCESANELRAVLKALKSGEWGCYLDLENHTREKLIKKLFESDKNRILTITTKPSPSDMLDERESLHTWLGHLDFGASNSCNPTAANHMKGNDIPVRGVKHTDLSNPHLSENVHTKPNAVASISKKNINKPLSKRSKQKLDEYVDDGNVDGTPNGSDDDDERYIIEELFTPGALKDEKLCTSNISPEKSSGALQSLTNELHVTSTVSETWHKMSIVEAESLDDDVEEAIACMRRVKIVEESDGEEHEFPQNISANQRNDSDKLKAEGNNAMAQRRFGDAVIFYTHALQLNPCNYAAFHNRSIAYFRLNQWGESIADASACLVGEPNNTKALYRRGIAQMMHSHDESSIEKARCDFEQSLSHEPPTDQRVVLLKKIDQCKTILSSCSEEIYTIRDEEGLEDIANMSEKMRKVRRHDSQALAF